MLLDCTEPVVDKRDFQSAREMLKHAQTETASEIQTVIENLNEVMDKASSPLKCEESGLTSVLARAPRRLQIGGYGISC